MKPTHPERERERERERVCRITLHKHNMKAYSLLSRGCLQCVCGHELV